MDTYSKVSFGDSEYPKDLMDIPGKKIETIYYMGNLSLLNKAKIGMVGSRDISNYGIWTGKTLAKKMAENDVAVVSGMARGYDSCAHWGAIEGGGITIAVLGCGIDLCYPAENKNLKNRIAKTGLVISQFPPGTSPAKWTFPVRNGLIAAFSDVLVVGEAKLNSGAMITAEKAIDLGKRVLAFPSNVDNIYSFGTNKLIRDGAEIITSFDDVLEALCIEPLLNESLINVLGKEEKAIYDFLCKNNGAVFQEISKELCMEASKVTSIVTILEIKGFAYTSMGRVYRLGS